MSAYDEFVSEFLNANTWAQRKDGVPLDLLDRLTVGEKIRAEKELLGRLDGKDTWPILGLAHLGSEQAIPRIEALVASAEPHNLPAIAEALFILTGSTSLEPKVTEIAKDAKLHFGSRIDALYTLAKLGTQTAKATLSNLTNDPQYLVAANARTILGIRDSSK